MVCVALQDYGMIVIDGTADRGLLFQMEDDRTAHWSGLIGEQRFGSYGWIVRDGGSPSDGLSRNDTSGIPWHRLRVLERSQF
jgi:hypothetical protein